MVRYVLESCCQRVPKAQNKVILADPLVGEMRELRGRKLTPRIPIFPLTHNQEKCSK